MRRTQKLTDLIEDIFDEQYALHIEECIENRPIPEDEREDVPIEEEHMMKRASIPERGTDHDPRDDDADRKLAAQLYGYREQAYPWDRKGFQPNFEERSSGFPMKLPPCECTAKSCTFCRATPITVEELREVSPLQFDPQDGE
jgi:hypothetical protein